MVLLDNHLHDSDWCCNNSDCNGLWFSPRHSTDDWVEMWRIMARRYANAPGVIGVGLKNEPRKVCVGRSFNGQGPEQCDPVALTGTPLDKDGCVAARWDTGPSHLQYRDAVTRAGRAALAERSDLLVGISGLDYATNFAGMRENFPDLPIDRILLEAHEYSWYHSSDILGVGDKRHACKLDNKWGHFVRDGVAPVLVSEFGFSHGWRGKDKANRWVQHLAAYLQERGPLGDQGGLDWAYWQLAGVKVGGTGRQEGDIETYGVMNDCWTAPRSDEHMEQIQALMKEPSAELAQALDRDCAGVVRESPLEGAWLDEHGVRLAAGAGLFFAVSALIAVCALLWRLRRLKIAAAVDENSEAEREIGCRP